MVIRKIENEKVKYIFKFIFVLFLAIIIEICVFNFGNISEMMDNSLRKNIVFSLKDAKLSNWENNNTEYISQFDPMIVYNNIDLYIKKIEIKTTMNKKIPYVDFFYTNKNEPEFNGNMLLKINEANQDVNVLIVNQYAKDIRIDLGDEAGVSLSDFSMIINPTKINFKVARVVAIVLIYYMSVGLFSLQKSPDYDIEE
ncbi:hypothetical protein [Lacrimispora sp.]|uniref:hypothetical protein n=1 Tax=Lacrimispora sp. TaxID=2719234 RepID=UPI0028A218F3|nr:hypothetical protein [Lacrimispora sp.]